MVYHLLSGDILDPVAVFNAFFVPSAPKFYLSLSIVGFKNIPLIKLILTVGSYRNIAGDSRDSIQYTCQEVSQDAYK